MQTVKISPWEISRVSLVDDFSETIFFTGNGTLGVRGFGAWADKRSPQANAVFRAGLFSEIKPGITDMVQLPDALTLRLLEEEEPQTVEQSLDLRRGMLTQRWETERAACVMRRVVSMADSQLMIQRLTVTAKQDGDFTVEASADAEVKNLPVHDNQAVEATELVQLLDCVSLTENRMSLRTISEGTPADITWTVRSDCEAARNDTLTRTSAVTALTAALAAGESWTVEKRVRVLVRHEAPHADIDDPWSASAERWQELWEDCDIEIESSDNALQGAIRFNIYQLLCNNASDDPTVSIGARGLSHGRYKGNTFWDTDIFMFPFYLWTRPEAARNLLQYRMDRFGTAKALAERHNLSGARYPWMCADTGDEQCETWDTGMCEVHVTADVVYAMQQYVEITGDVGLLRSDLAEIYRQTALYWMSRFTWEEKAERFSCFFVKGPDEYCGVTVNNTFTNYMARYNAELALRHSTLTDTERAALRKFKDNITILYDAQRDLYLQDETLERMEKVTFHDVDRPVYRKVSFDRMQRYNALKQADLVQLVTLFPKHFTQAQKDNIFQTYEPITVHDSTLSYGVHALAAFQLRQNEKAESYLEKAVYLDLKNLYANTGSEGIHLGACGILWQALVFGAAGLSVCGDTLKAAPNLPGSIRSIKFKVKFRGEPYGVSVRLNEDTVITKL